MWPMYSLSAEEMDPSIIPNVFVYKCGAETEIRKGCIQTDVNGDIVVLPHKCPYSKRVMKNQYNISSAQLDHAYREVDAPPMGYLPFAVEGDSGSVVFSIEDHTTIRPIGIITHVIKRNLHPRKENNYISTFATPISAIKTALNHIGQNVTIQEFPIRKKQGRCTLQWPRGRVPKGCMCEVCIWGYYFENWDSELSTEVPPSSLPWAVWKQLFFWFHSEVKFWCVYAFVNFNFFAYIHTLFIVSPAQHSGT